MDAFVGLNIARSSTSLFAETTLIWFCSCVQSEMRFEVAGVGEDSQAVLALMFGVHGTEVSAGVIVHNRTCVQPRCRLLGFNQGVLCGFVFGRFLTVRSNKVVKKGFLTEVLGVSFAMQLVSGDLGKRCEISRQRVEEDVFGH